MMEIAAQVKERSINELTHLIHVRDIVKPGCVIDVLACSMRSFAIFCETEDNVKLLELVLQLFDAMYVWGKKTFDANKRSNVNTILNTLKERDADIKKAKEAGQEFEFHFDFFPFIHYYYMLLLNGHKRCSEEEHVCNEIAKLMSEICEREIQVRHTAIETAEKLLA